MSKVKADFAEADIYAATQAYPGQPEQLEPVPEIQWSLGRHKSLIAQWEGCLLNNTKDDQLVCGYR